MQSRSPLQSLMLPQAACQMLWEAVAEEEEEQGLE